MNTMEIIREMEQDPALRASLRAVLLGEEFLNLPAEVRANTEAIGRLEKIVASHTEAITRLEKIVAANTKAIEELIEAQKRTEIRVTRLENDVVFLKGGYYESQWDKNATSYLAGHGYRNIHLLSRNDIADPVEDMEDTLRVDALNVDVVYTAVRRSDGLQVYVVKEVASRIHLDDVTGVQRRAYIIREATGSEVVACVAGASIADSVRSTADAGGVLVTVPSKWIIQSAEAS